MGGAGGRVDRIFFVTKKAYHKEKRPINRKHAPSEEKKFNHSINFVDPVTHATTKYVESMWARAKLRNKKECGTHRTLLTSYLLEFMWRQQYGKDPFQNLLEHMRNIYVV